LRLNLKRPGPSWIEFDYRSITFRKQPENKLKNIVFYKCYLIVFMVLSVNFWLWRRISDGEGQGNPDFLAPSPTHFKARKLRFSILPLDIFSINEYWEKLFRSAVTRHSDHVLFYGE
jgi:hypothetical protein